MDNSLSNYLSSMDDEELEEFFNRDVIQNIIQKNVKEEIPIVIEVPKKVMQVKKKTKLFYEGTIKGKRVLVKKSFIKIKGKRKLVYRDSKGRFAKRIR